MKTMQTAVSPNVIDLIVVCTTCFVVLALVFPLYAGEQRDQHQSDADVVKCEQQSQQGRAKISAPKQGENIQPSDSATSRPTKTAKKVEAGQDQKSRREAEAVAVDIEALTERLKNSDAIGLFTKLAIRGDIMDLIDEIEGYRKKKLLDKKIDAIRASFDGLLLKIVALLEEDPVLSRDLYVSRESIWKSLLEVKV